MEEYICHISSAAMPCLTGVGSNPNWDSILLSLPQTLAIGDTLPGDILIRTIVSMWLSVSMVRFSMVTLLLSFRAFCSIHVIMTSFTFVRENVICCKCV